MSYKTEMIDITILYNFYLQHEIQYIILKCTNWIDNIFNIYFILDVWTALITVQKLLPILDTCCASIFIFTLVNVEHSWF